MQLISLAFAALVSFASALPSAALEERQSGGGFRTVGNKYSGPGCTNLIFADPVFGNGDGSCQPLNRNAGFTPVLSYKTLSADTGCSVTLYTDLNCAPNTAFSAPVGGCVSAGSQFLGVKVTCAN